MYRFVVYFCVIVTLTTGNDVVSGGKINEEFMRIPLARSEQHYRVRRAVAGPNGNKLLLWNDKNIHYAFNATIGTPPQKFSMNMDTGSSDVWVPSKNCKSKFICRAINKYDASASTTRKTPPGDRSFKIQYAIGALTGVISSDVMSYGGMTVKDQIFAEAEYEPENDYNYPFDGTFGLGFAQVSNSDKNSTPIDNLYDQGQIKKKLFCTRFTNKQNPTQGGELLIGGCDVQAEAWMKCTQPNYSWQIKVDSVNVVAQTKNHGAASLCPNGCNALFDTGSSDIGASPEILDAIGAALGAPFNSTYNRYVIACQNGKIDKPETLPTIQFNFGTFKAILTAADYVGPYYGDLCQLGVSRTPTSTFDGFLLGDVFLRRFTAIFDKENLRVGIANLK